MTKKSEASGTQAYLYDADGRDREVDLESIAVGKLRPDDLLWIDVPDHDDASLTAWQPCSALMHQSGQPVTRDRHSLRIIANISASRSTLLRGRKTMPVVIVAKRVRRNRRMGFREAYG